MNRIYIIFIICFSSRLFSQQVSGIVTDEDQNLIPEVLVFNMKTEQKIYTNLAGEFTISASSNDELRFVRRGYERNLKVVTSQDFNIPFTIIIIRNSHEIEEVNCSAANGKFRKRCEKLWRHKIGC
ncbi:hypothetical protein Q73A0000_11035 [Kaistella flava (ex Peng et al. 2021)]|uniref:Carboxypeptidase-like regulatory domain-containing protein n=1 Tax=Kaistella flava (ex Peng et al. 2021) TaxID=2038776 RepID=A0A7M2YBP7_9FLAO|nr:carboxypeptidase-like regulatory domain-containing protein [Kaistella flava (ex Peng et al. 2021)]QOW10852.1 hypothetical protein Q73A0000_11035 [Kaistella flava (ex Peng et al. 2021)]